MPGHRTRLGGSAVEGLVPPAPGSQRTTAAGHLGDQPPSYFTSVLLPHVLRQRRFPERGIGVGRGSSRAGIRDGQRAWLRTGVRHGWRERLRRVRRRLYRARFRRRLGWPGLGRERIGFMLWRKGHHLSWNSVESVLLLAGPAYASLEREAMARYGKPLDRSPKTGRCWCYRAFSVRGHACIGAGENDGARPHTTR